jgi:hypothetical protein
MHDYQWEFSNGQSLISSSAAHTISTNVVDLFGAASSIYKNAWGTAVTQKFLDAEPMLKLTIVVKTAMAGGKKTTVLYNHTAATSIHSGTAIISTSLPASTAAGYQLDFIIPQTAISKRYLGIDYLTASGAITAGAVSAWLGRPHETE